MMLPIDFSFIKKSCVLILVLALIFSLSSCNCITEEKISPENTTDSETAIKSDIKNIYEGSASEYDSAVIKSDKSYDVRIYNHNVYGVDTEKCPLSIRSKIMGELIKSFDADILGFQEFNATMRISSFNLLKFVKSYGYLEVSVKHPISGTHIQTPIFYKPDKVELIDKGYDFFEGTWNNGNSKGITWAVFKDIDTGKIFAYCCTHFFYQSEATSGRTENAKVLVSRCKTIYQKYKCPIIAGGDLNTKMPTEPITTLKNGGLTHIYDLAKNKIDIGAHHAYPQYSEEFGYLNTFYYPHSNQEGSIDHIFSYKADSLEFINYYVSIEEFALMSSDHCPIVVDFLFKN